MKKSKINKKPNIKIFEFIFSPNSYSSVTSYDIQKEINSFIESDEVESVIDIKIVEGPVDSTYRKYFLFYHIIYIPKTSKEQLNNFFK